MKTVSRNKFMLCFRPVVDNMDLVLDHPSTKQQQQQLLYLGVDQNPSPADSPRPRRKSFSQAVKAVVFETILAKRVRDKNACSVISFDRNPNSSRPKRSFREDKDREKSAGGQSLNTDSAPPSSSCSYSSFSTQEPVLKQVAESENGKIREESESKLKGERRARDRGSGVDSAAVQLVLVSITLTVLWGRVCAILFTLIWLYLLPSRQGVRAEDERKRLAVVKSKGSSAESCREKVIMDGLLDRTNRRGRS